MSFDFNGSRDNPLNRRRFPTASCRGQPQRSSPNREQSVKQVDLLLTRHLRLVRSPGNNNTGRKRSIGQTVKATMTDQGLRMFSVTSWRPSYPTPSRKDIGNRKPVPPKTLSTALANSRRVLIQPAKRCVIAGSKAKFIGVPSANTASLVKDTIKAVPSRSCTSITVSLPSRSVSITLPCNLPCA